MSRNNPTQIGNPEMLNTDGKMDEFDSLPDPDPESDDSKSDSVDNDAILSIIGDVGKYQIILCLVIAFFEVPHAWCMVGQKFSAPSIGFWCSKPPNFDGNDQDWIEIVEAENYDPCWINGTTISHGLSDGDTKCTNWTYDTSTFKNTATEKWNLVCDRSYYPKMAQSIFFSGVFVGVFIAGVASDRYGRKNTMFALLLLFIVSGLCSAFASSFEMWVTARWFMAFASLGMKTVKSVIGVEAIGGKWRAIVVVGFYEGGWTLGFLSLPLVSYLLPDTLHYELFIALFAVLLLPIYFVLPESPRWLYSVGRLDECADSLSEILRFNGKPADKTDILDRLAESHKIRLGQSEKDLKPASVVDLCTNPAIFMNLVIVSMAWFATGMMYFGLSIYMPEFSGNIHLLFFLQGLAEIPADFLPIIALNKFGRRWNNVVTYFIGGLMCMLTAFIPQGRFPYEWPIVVLAIMGKFFSQVSFGICYLYTNELFPTVLRNNALSIASCAARIGSILAPVIATLDRLNPTAPLFVFGCIFFVVGIFQTALPETLHHELPNSVDDGEKFLRKNQACKCFKSA